MTWITQILPVPLHEELGQEWATTRGSPIFVGRIGRAKKVKAGGTPAGKQVEFTRKDGTKGTKWVYPAEHVAKASDAKFSRVGDLAKQADKIEAKLRQEVRGKGEMTPPKMVAVIILLMRETGIRVGEGSDKPGKTKGDPTYGATSLQKQNVKLQGDAITLDFRGKSGVTHALKVRDHDLANALRQLLGGQDEVKGSKEPLFPKVTRQMVAARLKKFNANYTAKDLRTLKASEAASAKVLEIINRQSDPEPDPEEVPAGEEGKKKRKLSAKELARRKARALTKEVAQHVAGALGNTPSVALAKYIHPDVIEHMLRQRGLKEEVMSQFTQLLEAVQKDNAAAKDQDVAARYPKLVDAFGLEAVQQWLSNYAGSPEGEDDDADEEDEVASLARAVNDGARNGSLAAECRDLARETVGRVWSQ